MTAGNLAAVIGSTGVLTTYTEGLRVPVTIKDAREMWGRTDYLVTPIGGTGEKWVEQFRVSEVTVPTTATRTA